MSHPYSKYLSKIRPTSQDLPTPMIEYKEGGTGGTIEPLEKLKEILKNKGFDYKQTSGVRPGAKTKQGLKSRHSSGEAMDLVFPKLGKNSYNAMLNDPEIARFMLDNNLTAIDEYDEDNLKKTGGTGGHLHIGLDRGTALSDKFRKDANSLYGAKATAAEVLIRPKNVSKEQWDKAVQLYNVSKNRGDRYPELTVAQAAIETGWFESPAGKYNYFGQKATASQKGSIKSTREVANNSYYRTSAKFRDYDTLEEAVDDRIKKWGSKYKDAENIDEAIGSIWRYNPETGRGEGYATDIHYASKLKTILGSMGVSSNKRNPQSTIQETDEKIYNDSPIGDYYVDSTVRLNQNSGEYMSANDYYESEESIEDVEGNLAKEELKQAQQEKNFLEDFQRTQQQQQDFAQVQGLYPQQSGYELYIPELPEIQAQQAPSYFQDGGVQGVIDYTKFNKILKRFEEGGDFVDTYSDIELEADTEAEDEGKPKPGTKKPAIPKFEYKKKSIDDVIKQNKENLYKTSGRDNISNLATPVKRNVEAQVKQKEYKEKTTVNSLDEYSKELANKATLEDTIENKDIDLGIGLSNYKTVGERKKLQKFLIDQGYNLNPEGKFENEGIDGKIGKVTLKAVQEYNKNLSNPNYYSFKEGEGLLGKCTEGQCSEYAQNELFRNIQPNVSRQEWNEKTGLYGNAWDIGKNIATKGGKEVDRKTVKPGDVVTMYTGGSSAYQREADAAGTGTTHVGIVDKVNPDGSYYILHNNHTGSKDNWQGREFRELVKNDTTGIHNFTVKHAFRPKYEAVESGEKKIIREDLAIKIDPKKSAKLSSGNYNNLFTTKSAKEKLENYYIKPLNDSKNKKALSKVFNLGDDEYNSLAKATLGILGQESDFGTNIQYTTGTKRAAATGLKNVGYKKDEVSKGAGQMKYETNFGNDDLTEIGITKDNFNDEDKASLTTMYKVSRDYKKFLNKGFSKKDALYRAVTNYNSSMGRVVNGKKVEDWAKTYDVDYTNKVLNFSNIFDVTDGKKSYKTTSDKLLLNKNVAKWKAELKKANKL